MAKEANEEQNHDQLTISCQKQLPDLHDKEEAEEREESMAESFPILNEVERIIGYNFRDRSLLHQAFTHGSCHCSTTSSYERLEYVGDSVLNLLIAREDYFAYPDLQPGKLTRLRAANVDTEKLARVAVHHNLHTYLRHKKPLLDGQIRDFMDAIADYPLHSSGLINAPKVLADIVESTIGAIFIDSNSSLDTTWKVVKRLLEPRITPTTLQTHPVTRVNELCQKHGLKLKFVDLWKETGEIKVFIDNEFVERATYSAKRFIAQNRAAYNAYNRIIRKLSPEEKTLTNANMSARRKVDEKEGCQSQK